MRKYPLWRFHVDTGPASLFRWEYHDQLRQGTWNHPFCLSNRAKHCLGDLPLALRSRVEKFVLSSVGWDLVVVKLRAADACPWFFIWETRTSYGWCHLHVGFEVYKIAWGHDESSRKRDLPKNIIVGGGVYDVVASLAAQDNFGWLSGWNLRGDLMHIVKHPIELA